MESHRDDGLLLVGHGTRDPAGTREFFQLASLLADRLKPMAVEGCLLEFQRPTIREAWQTLVDHGARRIRVAPLLLFAAGHARSDIPEALLACQAETPHIRYTQSGPLSRAPSIIDLLVNRITESATASNLIIDDSVGLVTVGRGSFNPCAEADMRILGEIVARRLGFSHHAVGFYAMAQPRLPEVLDRIVEQSEVRSVIVQPHLLFQGRLYDAIRRQVGEASERHQGIQFVVGDYLGPVTEVADALARRALSKPPMAAVT